MKNHFSLKGKITRQTLNNFTILNKDYNIWIYNLGKEKFFFFSLMALCFTVYLSQFSLVICVFLLFCLLSLTQFFKTTLSSHSGILSAPNGQMTFPFISSSLSSFLPFTRLSSIHNKCKPTCFNFCT